MKLYISCILQSIDILPTHTHNCTIRHTHTHADTGWWFQWWKHLSGRYPWSFWTMAFPHFRASGSWWLMFGESSPAVSGVGRDQSSRLTVLRCKVRSWWCKKTGRMIAICVQWSSLDNWWLDECDLPLESGNFHGTKCPVRLMPKNRCRRSGLNNFAHSVFLPKPPHKIGGKSRQSVLKWRPTEEKQRHCLLQKPQLLAVACRFQGQVTFSPYWKFRLPEVKTPLDSSPEGAYRDFHGGMWKHDETLQC